MIGAGLPGVPKCSAKRSGSMVADVMINFRFGAAGQQPFQVAEDESMFRLRSCASSMISVSYWRASGPGPARRAGCRLSSA